MSTTRIKDTDYADIALYDKVNQIADEIDAEVESKQPKLIAGENVIIQGNTISAKGGALGDEITVITTEDDKAQAIGVIEKNKSNPKYDWIGTLAEYQSQAVATNHPDWVCYITDDNTADAYEAYSKTETDELLNDIEEVVETKLDDKHRTNCITEIPQDIKLELVDGTLTLKAGSKVWIPYGTTEVYQVGDTDAYNHTVVDTSWNGSKFFYAIETTGDVSFPSGTPVVSTSNRVVSYNVGIDAFGWVGTSGNISGTSADVLTTGLMYYNTTRNIIRVNNATSGNIYSLPFCLIGPVATAGVVDTLDQTFNGFGFMGYATYTLPGLTYLVPNGFNEDGTLRNTKIVTNKVLVHEKDSSINSREFVPLFLSADGYMFPRGYDYTFSKTGETYNNYYDSSTNKMYYNGNSTTYTEYANTFLGYANIDSSGRYTSIKDATVFNPLTIRDKQTLTNLSMPSNNVVNLTLGASGSSYTMPATGWLKIDKSANDQEYLFVGTSNGPGFTLSASGVQGLCATIPVKRNDIVLINYNASRKTNYFMFIYAEGSL